MIKAAADKKAEDALRADLECQYGLLAGDDLSTQLENLMGEADKSLDIVDYGSEQAKDYARRIRAMANQLIQKTSTDNKLALEGFVFAREISAQE